MAAIYLPLIDTISKESVSLANVELSWSGRLAAFKMLLLPQILYIFRTLPIPVPSVHFKALSALLSRFIWHKTRPRCSKVYLVRHRLAGGMGLVDIHDYFRASILVQLRTWLDPNSVAVWKIIEQDLCPVVSLKDFLLIDI